jgi:hypothetical protein
MLAWAMGGSHTGHTTEALWIDGELHVCESTTKDSYWPTNGIQCTAFDTWVAQAIAADYNVVWVPLSDEMAGAFNETSAWEFVQQNMGMDYGFGNLLWGWMDNLDNYPFPLTWQLHMMLPAWIGKLAPATADMLWNRAFNLRLGTSGLDTIDLYAAMDSQGLDFVTMTSIPEQDSWLYYQKNNNGSMVYGHSMVCDVFVCELWRAAGLFNNLGDEFQCTEATNWDVYTLTMFQQSIDRPQQCIDADPNLPFCQLAGQYELTLPYWNTRNVYPNSFNNCPRGSAPDWEKPVGC